METEFDAEAVVDGGAPGHRRDHEPAAGSPAPEGGIERLTIERDALRARLIETEQELAELPGLRAAQEELESIRSSLTWRLTAPLRRSAASISGELGPRARLLVKRLLLRVAPRLRP